MASIPNFAETAVNALNAGRQLHQQQLHDQALTLVGSDPAAAQNALMQAGDFQSANALGQSLAQQRALKTQADVAPLIQKGDYQGAATTAAAGGQYDVAGELAKLDAGQRQKAATAADALASAAFGLGQIPLDQGPDPLATRKAAFAKVAPHLQELGLKPEQLSQVDLSDQSLKGYAQQALSVKDMITQKRQQDTLGETKDFHDKSLKHEADVLGETKQHDRADEKAAMARAAGEGWQVMLDTDGTPYRINARTGQAVTVNGGQPYSPSGVLKPGNNNPRSAAVMAAQQFKQEHPNATSEDMTAFNAQYRAKAKATSDFATGSQGKTVNSLNVAVQHLATMQEAADALHNGDVQLFNKIAKDIQTQTGNSAPTNFDTTKQIVTTEVVKAITGAGGGVADREHAQAVLSKANSPAQLSGAITQIKQLMGGQLNGLRLQYKNSTGLDDFETHLAPETRAALEGPASKATSGSVIHYDAQGNRTK